MARTRVLNELNRLNPFIVDCEVRIEAQRQRIDWIKQGGGNAEDSEKLLNNLISSSSALTRLRLTDVEELREREN
ncbi:MULTISPECIES: hypothetical protein [unclassified Caballeronia]|uniref:hypothetical protein n=1 Tax=unclassified Caballeronia TaxID=2646786 RepID=UPI002866A936|nr:MULTISPECIES: hypothetical protein [unclassified Caballeronia]MDR5815126.1 hypothetical protein [Caballeronia sp. LZ033]MDR5821595.1 hypothetical protein [Caballeronia sp. LZ043]